MRAVVQRVREASVTVGAERVGTIGPGLLALVGVGQDDSDNDVIYLVDKLQNLRVFPDAAGKLNLSVKDSGGSVLVVSQFTLYGDCRRGRRPSFSQAAGGSQANRLYEAVVSGLRDSGLPVETGEFGADMQVSLVNDGPVTLLLDSKGSF